MSSAMPHCYFPDQLSLEKAASALAQMAKAGDCFALYGQMGAGKSTFARAFIRAFCHDLEMAVPSPTFSLVQVYGQTPELFHYDLWRLSEGESLEELGWEEAERGIMLVEWPEHAGSSLPQKALHLFLSFPEEQSQTKADLEAQGRMLRWSGDARLIQILEKCLKAQGSLR